MSEKSYPDCSLTADSNNLSMNAKMIVVMNNDQIRIFSGICCMVLFTANMRSASQPCIAQTRYDLGLMN